jgi:tetratricopeptide (TPR) repeat protein
LNSAWAAAGRYDFARGEERANEALELYRQVGDTANAALVESWLLIVPFIMGQGGDMNDAAGAASRAFDVSRNLGLTHDATNWLDARALIHLRAGDYRRGIQATQRALAGWYDLGNMGRLPLCFKMLAALELMAGRPERAVRLGTITERYSEEIGGDLAWVFGQLGDAVEQARPLLDPKEHARAVEEARAMSPDEQIAYALQAESSDAELGSTPWLQ